MINDLHEKHRRPYLLLDSGNALFDTPGPVAAASSGAITAGGIARIYREMGYDACNVGETDSAAGLRFLLQLEKVPWISVHFFDGRDVALFPAYVRKSIAGITVAITGVSAKPVALEEGILYKQWRQVLPSLLAEMEKQADFIIVLSSLSMQENEEIARSFPAVRLILTAGNAGSYGQTRQVNNAIFAQTSSRGQYLGHLFIAEPQHDRWQSEWQKKGEQLQAAIAVIDTEIAAVQGPAAQDQAVSLALMRLQQRRAKLGAQLQRLQTGNTTVADEETSSFRIENIPLTTATGKDKEIEKLVEEIKKRARPGEG